MSTQAALPALAKRGPSRRIATSCLAVALVICGIALDTKVVAIGSFSDTQEQGFSMEAYGPKVFPSIQKNVESRAVPASELAMRLKEDRQQAIDKYGVGSPLPVFPISFTGTVGSGKKGLYTIMVADVPPSLHLRLQTGPVITGTDLRDATGKIMFGDFTNQIEYQNAGTSINQAMKSIVLAPLDTSLLSGKQVKVVGIFRLLSPDNWLVTPVRIEIQ
ncbi:DUF2291 domain-containing protein [Buttiauxella sp. B2]|uniref:DUF2291 family protein n=1 Tax=Buttiauxella sp. B2 TaxID=2587812 RepID=UPI00111E46A3|nr:DUF2291 domain-containing protein [Buttiauxella sp. B2]TNV11107.1 DUF2291 domain-containing protein [Buttiauxella sp. B2]